MSAFRDCRSGHPAAHRVLGLILGGVFLYASYDKIAHPAEFARIVYHYQLVGPSQNIPPLVPNLLAVILPWVEAVCGALLLLGAWRREAAGVVAAMLVTFLLAVGWALAHGINVEKCGCFSVTGEGRQLGWALFLGDLALLAAATTLAMVKPEATGPLSTPQPASTDPTRAATAR